MGTIFGSQKPLKEVVRENQRMLKKAVRELEKEISNMKKSETKLISDIKKAAKENQAKSVRIMVKDLVRTRSYITRFIEMKTQLNAVSLKLQVVKSQEAMATAMKGVTKALGMMNKKMDIPGLQKIMAEFMRENEKAEFVQESMGDAIDDALEEPGSAEEEDRIVGQVMAEIGITMGEDMKEAPMGNTVAPAEEKKEETAGLSELEERLNNLRRT